VLAEQPDNNKALARTNEVFKRTRISPQIFLEKSNTASIARQSPRRGGAHKAIFAPTHNSLVGSGSTRPTWIMSRSMNMTTLALALFLDLFALKDKLT
jgi:hypothetical protein